MPLERLTRLLRLVERKGYRAQADELISAAITYVLDAAEVLKRSRYSDSAVLRYRSRIAGVTRRSAPKLARLGWWAGGGKGDPNSSIWSGYIRRQLDFLSRWSWQMFQQRKFIGGAYRGRMYAQSLETMYLKAYNQARSAKYGLPDLPAYPKDGSTRCGSSCNCWWDGPKKESETEYRFYWRMRPGESCEDCIWRYQNWSPLRFVLVDGQWLIDAPTAKSFG